MTLKVVAEPLKSRAAPLLRNSVGGTITGMRSENVKDALPFAVRRSLIVIHIGISYNGESSVCT